MTPRSCPDLATLEALLADSLSTAQQAGLADHLACCEACRTRLENLAMPTQFLLPDGETETIRAHAPTHLPPRELIERWQRQVPSALSTVRTQDATASILGHLEPAQGADELGRLGPYRVLGVIGQGGMGIVLLAADPILRRPVAIKLMLPELAAHLRARERFLREARSAAAVQHESVVVIHAVESGGDLPYLVMEYVSGHSLQHRLHGEGPLPAEKVAQIGAQIAEGLASAHARGVVHRDVKPANILIDDRTGHAKLTDFGLARAGDDPTLTQIGFVAGTPDYIAPEQARGRTVDHRADLYSLGATLFAAATGQPPPAALDTLGLHRRSGTEPPPSLRALAPQTPGGLAQLIERMLANDPADRPQSATEVAQALRSLARSRGRSRFAWRAIAGLAVCCAGVAGLWMVLERRGGQWPIRQAPLDRSRLASTANGPFLLDATRRFRTLADAVAAAPGGGVIEIDGNGPYTSPPIHLGRTALTLRAAAGVQPLLVLTPEKGTAPAPVLVTEAPLTLEGLSLRSDGQQNAVPGEDPAAFSAIVVRGGPFRAAHCRFAVGPLSTCIALVRSSGEIRACQFSADESLALSWAPETGQALELEHTLLAADGPVAIDFARTGTGPGEATLRIDHATIRAFTSIRIITAGGFAPAAHPFLRIQATGTIFDAPHVLAIVNTAATVRKQEKRPLRLIALQLRNYMSWRGCENLYPEAPSWLSLASRGRPIANVRSGPSNLDEWCRLWGREEAGSAMVNVGFRGPRNAPDLAEHALVAPQDGDFLSGAHSPGADLKRVGPGAAYDAWRASTSYDTWSARPENGPTSTPRSGSR
jgi:hypothetical protein